MKQATADALTPSALVNKVRGFYFAQVRQAKIAAVPAITQQQIANEIRVSFAYLNGLFKAVERGEPLPNIRQTTLLAFETFVRSRKL